MSREPRKPRLKRTDDIDGLRHYDVIVNDSVVGTVGQERSDTVHGYVDSPLGYRTTRTTWFWETPDNYGDYELRTRGEAVAGLVDFTGSMVD